LLPVWLRPEVDSEQESRPDGQSHVGEVKDEQSPVPDVEKQEVDHIAEARAIDQVADRAA
jgi:hypothetical protein